MTVPSHRVVNDEVLYTTLDVTRIDGATVAWLKGLAAANPRRRVRLCAHPDADDRLHEMVIVLGAGSYIRPHRHPGKSESFHMIEGTLSVLILGDDGAVRERIDMAAADAGKPFFYRLSTPLYHTVVPTSELVVFHEVTNGPFRREDTDFAPWAPEESADRHDQQTHIATLMDSVP